MYRNGEGYKDPVATKAIRAVDERPRRQIRKVRLSQKPRENIVFESTPAYVNPDCSGSIQRIKRDK